MKSNVWLLYGANGYTGKLIIEEALKIGLRPIIAGRNKIEIEKLADFHKLEHRIFSIDDLNNGLEGIDVVVNAAGPFIYTIDAFMKTCISKKIHYFDITGEIEVFEKAYSFHDQAVANGIVLCPGLGFDVVPTDCLALMLKEKFEDVGTSLELAFHGQGGISKGTRKTSMIGGLSGSKIRRDGEIKQIRYGELQKDVNFPHKTYTCTAISWGDVFTSFISTGIPNVAVFIPIHPKTIKKIKRYRRFSFLLKLNIFRKLTNKVLFKKSEISSLDGPTEETRLNTKSYIWGKIESINGNSKELSLITPNGYSLTALTTVFGLKKFFEMDTKGGFFTPSLLFGSSFILDFDGVELLG